METQGIAPSSDLDKSANPEPQGPVKLSDRAAAMVKETIERENLVGSGLRVAVVGGGCSGSISRRTSAPVISYSRSRACAASSIR